MTIESSGTDPAPAHTEILTIDELAPSAGIVRINGESYDLANTQLFGLRRRAEFQQLVRRVQALEAMEPEQMTEEDDAEYDKRLRQVAAIALPTATQVLGGLNRGQIGNIVVAFFVWTATNDPRMRMVKALTSAILSPASSGSTAATP